MNILNLPVDVIGAISSLIFTVIYSIHISRGTKKKLDNAARENEERIENAENASKKAYQDAIEAMQVHLSILRARLVDAENEIIRLRKIMEEKGVSI